MTMFDKREKAHENQFALDQEKQFRIINRRNKLLGLWVAVLLGETGAAAEQYAAEVIQTDFTEPGDEDVIRKVLSDLHLAGKSIDAEEIRGKLSEFEAAARVQLQEK